MALQPQDPFAVGRDFVYEEEKGYKPAGKLMDPNAAQDGVNQSTYTSYRKRHGLLDQNVQLMSVDERWAIYNEYWTGGWCDQVTKYSGAVAICLFDAEFNGGGVRLLQETLGLTQDGIIGQITLNACAAMIHASGEDVLVSAYLQNRLDRFRGLHNWADPLTREIWQHRLNKLAELLQITWRTS